MSALSGGCLVARVHFDRSAVKAVAIDLQRPLQVLASLRGRTPEECLRLLPKLFPLCGSAHALAALQAVEHAAAIAPELDQARARATLAEADALAAHVWRSGIEWPQLAGTPTTAPLVAQARRLVGQIALAVYPQGDWQRIGGGRLDVDAAALKRALAELQGLRAQLDLADTLATMREPMALAMSGTGAEWHARVEQSFVRMAQATFASFDRVEQGLQSMLGLTAVAAARIALPNRPGQGRGRVDTARGDLVYEIGIDCGRIVSCSMVAPTDRIFAVDGPVAQMLDRLVRADDPLRTVRWVLASWDPCIEVQVAAAEPD